MDVTMTRIAALGGKLRQIATINDGDAPLAVTIARRPSRAGVPWSAERRARFEAMLLRSHDGR